MQAVAGVTRAKCKRLVVHMAVGMLGDAALRACVCVRLPSSREECERQQSRQGGAVGAEAGCYE